MASGSSHLSEDNQAPFAEEQDTELIAEFVQESVQGLSEIESDLLTLESAGSSDRELINRIFRTVHTIKGSGGYLKLSSLVSVAHRAETLLDNIRVGTQEPTPTVTDAVLGAIDTLKQMLDTADLGATLDFAPTIQKLDAALGLPSSTTEHNKASSKPSSVQPVPSTGLIESEIESIRTAFTGKALLYRIAIDLERIQQVVDVKEGLVAALTSIGKLLHIDRPVDEINRATSGKCCVYLETVLDKALLVDYFNFLPDSVALLDINELKPASAVAVQATVAVAATALPPAAQRPVDADNATSSAPAKLDSTKAASDQSMRVPVHILHKLLEWTGTMVMARNQLMNEYEFNGNTAFRTLSQAISGVHETVIETRMQTTGSLFERYRRMVRDLARQLGKEVALHVEGGDLELDRTILESFADPLTHLIRNSLDHALETPAEREAAGKNRQGNVTLKSYIHSGEIILAVEDDGRGISGERVCEKAISKGILSREAASRLSEHEKVMLVFQPGFSTKDEATDLSGRGVGMDVVRNNIESVGGSIDVQSRVGSGTVFSAILPLAKALVSSSLTKALIVDLGLERLAIPETAISEIIRFDDAAKVNVVQVDGENVYQLRDQLVALVDLEQALSINKQNDSWLDRAGDSSMSSAEHYPCLVVLQYRKHLFGAIVDHVVGIQEIIVRGTPKLLQNCQVYSGHTVLGNGQVSLILDINGVVNRLALNFTERRRAVATSENKAVPPKKRARQKMVIFTYAENEYFAIPLELVAIIERIAVASIKTIGNKEYVQIKNDTISVMRLDSFLPISPISAARQDCCLIRPAAISYPIGILTGPDVTIVEVDDSFDSRMDDSRGVVGTFLHNERLVMLLDLFSVFEKHAPDKIKQADVSTGHAKILVAEDSLFFRKLILQYMQRDEWTVDVVCDGQEAWEKLQAEPRRYNLVISDINMPRLDGFQLAQRIREDRRFDGLPLVALTTLSEEHFREKGLSLGFDRYVIKIDKNQVRGTVAECLKIIRQGRQQN